MILILAFRDSTVLPFWDHWALIGELARGSSHYTLAQLWEQHNEHRILIPKIFLLVDFFFFKAKNHFLLVCILVAQIFAALFFVAAVRLREDLDRCSKVTLYGLILFLLFSPVQMDNFVWGFQITFVLATFFTIVSLYCFSKVCSRIEAHRDLYFFASLFAALCATLSLASGLFVWPILILAGVARKIGRRKLLLTFLSGLLIYSAYFYHYQRPSDHSSPLVSLGHPLILLRYLSLYLGGAWIVYGQKAASIVGFAGILLSMLLFGFAGFRWKRISSSDLFFLSIILFVLVAGSLTGLGRIRFGVVQGYSSRYQTIALLLWAAALSLSISWLSSRFGGRSAVSVLALFAGCLLFWSPFAQLDKILDPYAGRAGQWRVAEDAAVTGVGDSEMERAVIGNPQSLPPLLDFLRERHLSVFSEARFRQIGLPMNSFYSVDPTAGCEGGVESSVPENAFVSDGRVHSGFRLMGWALDKKTRTPISRLLVVAEDGSIEGVGTGGYADPRAGHALNGSSPDLYGWFGYRLLQPGADRFRIFGVLRGGKRVCLIDKRSISPRSILSYAPNTSELMKNLSKTSQGVFRSGQWWRDVDHEFPKKANGLSLFGQKGDLPVIGDWNGTGKLSVGVFRDGQWWLDTDGNGRFDPGDRIIVFGQKGDLPITGDWDGSGRLRMGIFRDGQWWLDMNGNGRFDPGDRIIVFGQKGDLPVVGDWDGTGRLRIGVFRGGEWWLDMNGDLKWQEGIDQIAHFGQKGDLPVVGNWDSVGKLRIGVFRNGHWILDLNGNNSWDGPEVDRDFIFGEPNDITSVLPWPN